MMFKKKMMTASLMALVLGFSAMAFAADAPAKNPFGLVYRGAITQNEKGKVNIRPVEYKVEGIKVVANLYLPADYDEKSSKLYPAVTVAHPNGGSKEQVAGLYAQRLAISPLPVMPAIRERAAESRD